MNIILISSWKITIKSDFYQIYAKQELLLCLKRIDQYSILSLTMDAYYKLKLFSPFKMRINKLLGHVTINKEDINRIVRNSNPNKVHGWDYLFLKMIKICGDFIFYH